VSLSGAGREPNEGLRRHKLMTKELRKAFAEIGSQDGKGHDAIVIAKFFNPYGRGPWDTLYVTELDGEDTLFGYCISNGGESFDEWGYSSLHEIASATLPSGTPAIERDVHFTAKPLRECESALRKDDFRGSRDAEPPVEQPEEAEGRGLSGADASLEDPPQREFRYPRKYNGRGVVEDFRRLLDTGDTSKLTPRLYDFLTMSGGFIAHFNLNGFRSTYSGRLSELLDGEMTSFTRHDPRESPYRERLSGQEPKVYGGAPWEGAHLEDSGYKDGLSAADVMAEVCAVACELEDDVRRREEAQRRGERIGAMRAIAEAEGFTVTPSEE
jgi:Protein of unknown function (DUF2958)